MKKLWLLLLCLLLITPAFAWESEGWDSGTISAGLIGNGFARGGASDMPSGITEVPLNYSVVKKTYSNGTNEAGTLADGLRGQILYIVIDCVNTSGSFSITPTTKTGFSKVVIDGYRDSVTVLFMDNTNGWIIVGQNGATIS